MRILVILSLLLTSLAGCNVLTSQSTSQAQAPELIDDGWQTTAPVSAGFDPSALAALDREIRHGEWGNVHALLIDRGGKLVYERYYSGPDWSYGKSHGTVRFGRKSLHDIRSNGKTIVALALGAAQLEGRLLDLDEKLPNLLPDRRDLLEAEKASITLRHLLSMTSGLEWDEWSSPYGSPKNSLEPYLSAGDPNGWALSRPLEHEPGTNYTYSHASTQLLVEVIEAATALPFESFLTDRLLEPLEIYDVGWAADEIGGLPDMAGAMRLNARDMAKFGRLVADRGKWNGKQLIAAGFIDEMTQTQSTLRHIPGTPPEIVEGVDYSFQMWLFTYSSPDGPITVPAFSGNGEQRVSWIVEHDLVVTQYAGNYVGGGTPPDIWMPDRMLVSAILPAFGRAPKSSHSSTN